MYVRLLVLALVTVAIVFILLPFSLLLLGLLPSTSLSLDLLGFLHLLLGQTWVIERVQLQQAQYLEEEQLKTPLTLSSSIFLAIFLFCLSERVS